MCTLLAWGAVQGLGSARSARSWVGKPIDEVSLL
jgi:hypothetical protein